MAMNFERLLKLAADYHKFCNDEFAEANSDSSEELSLDELDFVAAAAQVPLAPEDLKK